MKAKAKLTHSGYIVEKNGNHTHIGCKQCKRVAKAVEELINLESRPNKSYLDYIYRRYGTSTTIEYLESRIFRLVSESKYKSWKYWKPKKQKYVNVNKGVRRVI